MLVIDNQEHFDKIKAFAESTDRLEQLQSKLDYLDTYGNDTKCMLGYDWAPHSFAFLMMKRDAQGEYQSWFNGGLIFHSDQGYWGVHT